MEGDLPEEMTAELHARIEVEGHEPIVIKDTFSGSSYSGGRAPQALYSPIASLVNLLTYNSYKPVRINKIECETTILPGRRSADIEAVELDSDTYAPGDTLKATVFVRPYKGLRQRLPVTLKLPADLPEGSYTALVCDDLTNARHELRDNPTLSNPQNLDQVFDAIEVQTVGQAHEPGAARADQRGRRGPGRQVAAEPAAEHGAHPRQQPPHRRPDHGRRPGLAPAHRLGGPGLGIRSLHRQQEQETHRMIVDRMPIRPRHRVRSAS